MGQTTSSLASKLTRPVSWILGRSQSSSDLTDGSYNRGVTPFIYTRQGSMFFDEDGDLAHEFYEQVLIGKRYVMRKCTRNLTPQGEVKLSHPRLNVDLPIVMCEAPVR